MDIVSTSTPSNGAGSEGTPAGPEIAPVAALPVCSESAEEITSSPEALILADPFADLPIGLPGETTTTTNREEHGQCLQSDVPGPEHGVSVATKSPSTTTSVSSSILPRYSYYRPSCHVPSPLATGRYSYSLITSFPSKSAAQSEASTNAADLEQRILALIAERDAAVATNGENAERIRLLEADAAELQVVLDEKNELKIHIDVLQADNATLRLEKDSVLSTKSSKGELDMLHYKVGDAASATELQNLDKRTSDYSEVQFASLREEQHAMERHTEFLQAEKDTATANIAELAERVKSESDQRIILQTRLVDLEANFKIIEDDSVRLLGTIKDLQHELAFDQDHRQHVDELESSNTKLSKALRGHERKLSLMRNQNNKYQRSVVFQHLAVSKLRDGLSSAYRAARDNVNPQSGALARLCGVVSTHLAELAKLEIWLLDQTPMTYDEIVKTWMTDDNDVELDDDAVTSNDGASRAKKRQRGLD
ncbi:hypothetical protein BDZ89DRAFT_1132996 [Hymenopellis radicata]|nr:hypothetical protein BDZ89DRAFT_1132996 [Hymenopellis radicata]